MRRELFTVPSLVGLILGGAWLAAGKSILALYSGPAFPRDLGNSFGPEFMSHLSWSLLLSLFILLAQEIRKDRSLLTAFGIGLLVGVLGLGNRSSAFETALAILPPILASVSIFYGANLWNMKHRGTQQVHSG
jgi:hypothetical protein